MAVPGSIFSPLSAGPHRLIRDGAAIITSADDVLAVLNLDQQTPLHDAPLDIALTPEEEAIYGAVSAEPQHIDVMVALPVSRQQRRLRHWHCWS
jgi:DNA processing protein